MIVAVRLAQKGQNWIIREGSDGTFEIRNRKTLDP
jgi:hypothetical protein